MTRSFRLRQRDRIVGVYRRRSYFLPGTTPGWSSTTYIRSETCSDYVGRPVADSPFQLNSVKFVAFGGKLHATAPTGVSTYLYHGEVDSWCPNQTHTWDPAVPAIPDGWMARLVAATNPSRPVVTPPTLIQDLVQLPAMVRDLGKLLRNPRGSANPAGIASTYLGVKFGWLPLVQDLRVLLDLQAHILRRNRELQSLYTNRTGLKRRIQFSNDTSESSMTPTVWNVVPGCTMSTAISKVEIRKVWATIHWYPTTVPPYVSGDERWNAISRRLVLGMTTEGLKKGLWDIIPWTWLLGWFSNIGSFMLTTSNTVPAQHGNGCLMRMLSTRHIVGKTTYSGPLTFLHRTDPWGYATYDRYARDVQSVATVSASIPYIGLDRLSVLGSLFAQRFLRR